MADLYKLAWPGFTVNWSGFKGAGGEKVTEPKNVWGVLCADGEWHQEPGSPQFFTHPEYGVKYAEQLKRQAEMSQRCRRGPHRVIELREVEDAKQGRPDAPRGLGRAVRGGEGGGDE